MKGFRAEAVRNGTYLDMACPDILSVTGSLKGDTK